MNITTTFFNGTSSPGQHLEELAINAVIFFFFGCVCFLAILSVIFFGGMEKQGCFYTCLKFLKLKFLTLCCCCCYRGSKKNTDKLERDMEELKDLVAKEEEEELLY